MDYTTINCNECGEPEDKKSLTGARIDGKYYGDCCYDKILWEKTKEGIKL